MAAYIETNINSNFRAADLAGIVQLSVSHFFRAFRRSFGETPHAYITKQRMRRAQVGDWDGVFWQIRDALAARLAAT